MLCGWDPPCHGRFASILQIACTMLRTVRLAPSAWQLLHLVTLQSGDTWVAGVTRATLQRHILRQAQSFLVNCTSAVLGLFSDWLLTSSLIDPFLSPYLLDPHHFESNTSIDPIFHIAWFFPQSDWICTVRLRMCETHNTKESSP